MLRAETLGPYPQGGVFPSGSLGYQSLDKVGYHLNDPRLRHRLLLPREAEQKELCDAKGEEKR